MRFAWLCALVGVATCRDATAPPPVARVVILAPDTAAVVGRTLRLYGVPYDSRGVSIPGVPLTWRALDASRAQVDSTGQVLLGPAAGDVQVVATAASGAADTVGVHAAAEGEVRWQYMVAGAMTNMAGPALGPDGTVYALGIPFPGVQEIADLYALTPHGALRWSRRLDRTSVSGVLVGLDGTVYVTGRTVRALTPDGSIKWSRVLDSASAANLWGALPAGQVLIVAGEHTPIALDIVTGDTVWNGPPSPTGRWILPPTIAGDTAWLKKTADTLYALDIGSGVLRSVRIPDPDGGAQRTFGVGPVPLPSRILVPSAYQLAAFDPSGAGAWSTPPGGWGVSEPVLDAAGGLYMQTTGGGLIALTAATGVERWRAPTVRSRWLWYGGPALAQGGVIYAAGLDGVYAYDTSGALRWRYQTMEDSVGFVPFIGAPAVAPDGTVYTYTDTRIYAFWASHPPEPNSPWPMWRHDARRSGVAR